ncbi:MAG: PAS domain S-box protein [Desulfobulbaceae bacterium]|nr:PAS domain S-box protein [Desulfobulbaceae bacterium]
MNQQKSPINVSYRTRRLLGVNVVTFFLVALASVWMVLYSQFITLLLALVFAVALVGLLLSRKLGAQLENMAEEAIRAKILAESVNAQLQIEIAERRQAEESLREASDHLDRRVRERTAQLAASNLMLQEEIDIRFKAEEALAAEKERLAVTLRSIDDGVISTDREGLVVLVNKVGEEITGWSQEEALGRPLAEIFPLCDRRSRAPVADLLDRDRRSGRVAPRHNLLLARDGRERLLADSGSPILDMEGRVVGWALVFRDISEQEKLGEELLKIRQLESVGVLAGGIAHDFNNILAAILGNINLVMMTTDPNDRRYQLLDRAVKASLRAKDLTQQLLTFSKGGEPVKKITTISEIIEDSAEFVLRGSKSKCSYLLPKDLWPVEVDAGQISQVVQNIALNADQAMPDGGKIEIVGANFDNRHRFLPEMPDRLLRLTIKDNGAGIAPEQVARIFDPYFTTKQEGSGLGLAITHSIIVKHGGHISVESQAGQGTTFTIYLVAAEQACAGEPPVEERIVTGSGRILVLDDEEMVREVAREMLERLGYEVLLVGDGREVIDCHRQCRQEGRPIDLFLVDLTIPGGMGGREVIETLRALDPSVRAVAFSGYSNDPVVASFQDYGFAAVVAKPFRVEELAGVIASVMNA